MTFLQKSTVIKMDKNFPDFMEPIPSLRRSQDPAIWTQFINSHLYLKNPSHQFPRISVPVFHVLSIKNSGPKFYIHFSLPHVRVFYISQSCVNFLFDCHNNVRWGVQIMKLLIMQLPSSFIDSSQLYQNVLSNLFLYTTVQVLPL
jgi:hypothetical protein